MVKRILSAVVGVSLILAVLLFNTSVPVLINIVVAIVCVAAVYEVFAALGIYKTYIITIPSLLFAAVMPMLGEGMVWQVSWYVYTVVVFCIMIFMHKVLTFKDFAVIYSLTMIITISLSKIVCLRDFGGKDGIFFVVLSLALPWMADTGAYVVGSMMGKHKLCPEISPKKSIEGAVGGFLFCIAATLLCGLVFDLWIFGEGTRVNYLTLLLVSVVGAALSIMGDLCFSLIKRGCHIKDFGNVIPGHGGILDRFDSVVFVAPFLYFMAQVLPFLSTAA